MFKPAPKQREFARLNVTYTVMSKRYLRKLVEENLVDGWDDPRMPTICGLRRRGFTPASIFDFVKRAGIAKNTSLVDIELLEHCIREELNMTAERRIAVMDPIKLVIDNYPEDKVEYFEVANNPNSPDAGMRKVPFTREVYIDRSDFAEVPPPKFFRLKPDSEVRLMGAYIVKCADIIKDADGNIVEIHCTADLETGNGKPVDGRKVKGTIHWVSAKYAKDIKVAVYGRLFTLANMNDMAEGTTYDDYLNRESVKHYVNCKAEEAIESGVRYQFVRTGYFIEDTKNPGTFIQIVELKDSFSK